jgi:hypothetical protein
VLAARNVRSTIPIKEKGMCLSVHPLLRYGKIICTVLRYTYTQRTTMNRIFRNCILLFSLLPVQAFPQKEDLTDGLEIGVEAQASLSDGKTPLWLNANKYGLSSLDKGNGYVRISAIRPAEADTARVWEWGYGADVAAAVNFTSTFVVQQMYVEARWMHGAIEVGAKEHPLEMKNQSLSSGSQTLGINARPIPQIRLALPEYWTLPFANGWIQLKGHIAYGVMTDGNWQKDFTQQQSKYSDNVLYHSKAGYIKIGKSCPFSVELGLEMAAEFGGNAYKETVNGLELQPTEKGIKGFWHALLPSGSDARDGLYHNVAGNQLGSYLMRINYDADHWTAHLYADHFFEDHSQMFLLDYDGYGEGSEWMTKKDNRFFRYALKDMLLGAELNLKECRWIQNIVLEYICTKYQSGSYNHDHTVNIPDHVAGIDNYYNHDIYAGWQHWGQVIGNPLYRSPIYNTDGRIQVENNRFIAYHIGVDGQPTSRLGYRALISYQKGWGTYSWPFTKPQHSVSFLVEGNCRLNSGLNIKLGYGMDFGNELMFGNNAGVQITVSKHNILNRKKKEQKK